MSQRLTCAAIVVIPIEVTRLLPTRIIFYLHFWSSLIFTGFYLLYFYAYTSTNTVGCHGSGWGPVNPLSVCSHALLNVLLLWGNRTNGAGDWGREAARATLQTPRTSWEAEWQRISHLSSISFLFSWFECDQSTGSEEIWLAWFQRDRFFF